MERVRISELKAGHLSKTGERLTLREVADKVFRGDGIADTTGLTRLTKWDKGVEVGSCRPRHLLRLARMFNTNDITKLVQS